MGNIRIIPVVESADPKWLIQLLEEVKIASQLTLNNQYF